MSGFELGALVSAIKFLFESIGVQIKIPAEKRKKWFEEHIEPSYRQLTSIHEDYTRQFSKALQLLNEGKDLEEVVQILQAERPNLLLKRQETRENLLALRDYRLEKRRKPKVVILFYDYVSAVDDYLSAASPLPHATWYSYFIRTFSDLVGRGKNPLEFDYPACAQGKDAPSIAKEELMRAVQENMPEAFRRVQEDYAKLRAQCLSQV
jgi:hypothetical protein